MMGVLGYKRLLIFSLNHNYRFSDSGNEQSQLWACAGSLHKAHTLNRFVETRTAAAVKHNYRFSDSGNEQSQFWTFASLLHKAHTLNRFVETRTAAAVNHNYRFSDSGNEQSQLWTFASLLHKATGSWRHEPRRLKSVYKRTVKSV
jgi:hypothetical protein